MEVSYTTGPSPSVSFSWEPTWRRLWHDGSSETFDWMLRFVLYLLVSLAGKTGSLG
jgi:hypothetical protein